MVRKTLLEQFFDEKISEYQVPTREGTPRGEKIGYSSEKFRATLYLLKNEKLKKISEDLGTSYGVLRGWTIETEFKNYVEKHCQEFSKKVLDYIRKKNQPFNIEEDVLFSDLHHYSDTLVTCIVEDWLALRRNSLTGDGAPLINAFKKVVDKLPRSEDKIKALASFPSDNWDLRARM